MASESTSVTLTLIKGPLTHTIRGLSFRLNEPRHIAIDSSNREIIERLRLDPNFRYEGPSKKKAKKLSSSPPPPPKDEPEDEDEDSDEETDDGEGEEESEESESKSEEFSRASLRGLKKGELLKISKKLKVRGVDESMSRSAIVDAIIETQGAKS